MGEESHNSFKMPKIFFLLEKQLLDFAVQFIHSDMAILFCNLQIEEKRNSFKDEAIKDLEVYVSKGKIS
jgi:hypothetical protein